MINTLCFVSAAAMLVASTSGVRTIKPGAQVIRPMPAHTPRRDTISGQVFIVTRGRENMKLGLVRVALLPEDSVEQHVARKRAAADVVKAARGPQMLQAEAAVDSAASLCNYIAHFLPQVKEIGGNAYLRNLEGYQEALRKYFVKTTLLPDSASYYYWFSGAYYFEGLPPAVASAQTDADGKFALRVPRNRRFALAAHAEREVAGGSKEEYYWLVRIPPEARDGMPVFLSNDTLSSQDSPLSLIKTNERKPLTKLEDINW